MIPDLGIGRIILNSPSTFHYRILLARFADAIGPSPAVQTNFLRRRHASVRSSRCDYTSTIGEITCPVSSIATSAKNHHMGRSAALLRKPMPGCQKNHAITASKSPGGIPLHIQQRSQAGLRIHFTAEPQYGISSNRPS
jgi:hypothetical protein